MMFHGELFWTFSGAAFKPQLMLSMTAAMACCISLVDLVATRMSSTVWELLNHDLNLWWITWGKHWDSCARTGEGNSPLWPEGVEPVSTFPRPHLRADCHWERISFSRLLPLEFFCKPKTWVSTCIYFWSSLSTLIILLVMWRVKYQPNHTTLPIVYLLIVHPCNDNSIKQFLPLRG